MKRVYENKYVKETYLCLNHEVKKLYQSHKYSVKNISEIKYHSITGLNRVFLE